MSGRRSRSSDGSPTGTTGGVAAIGAAASANSSGGVADQHGDGVLELARE